MRDFGLEPMVQGVAPNTLHLLLAEVKVSFLRQTGIRMESGGSHLGAALASLPTLIARKMNAVANRGDRKDFVDLYALCDNGFSVDALLAIATEYAPSLNPMHLLRSLTHFADAEESLMPRMHKLWSWEEIRRFFECQVDRIVGR